MASAAARVWRIRDFALYMGGGMPSYVSSWMQRIGVAWLAWELTHSTTWLGLVAAADLAPMIVIAPFAGAITDRGDPFRQFKITQFLLLGQALALAWLQLAGVMSISWLLVLSLWSGLVYPFHQTSRHSTVTRILPRADLAAGIASDSALFQASRFVGPAIAGPVIAFSGVGATFVAHAIGSAIFCAALLLMRVERRAVPPRTRGNLLTDVVDALRYARGHAGIWPLFVMLAMACVFLRPVQEMLPAFASDVYHSDAVGLAWLASAVGVGALVSAGSIALRGSIRGLTLMAFIGLMTFSLSTAALVATDNLWLGVFFAGIGGWSLNTMSTSVQTMTQSAVEDSMRGRVMGVYSLIWRGSPAVGALVGGFLADRFGVRATFAGAASICFAAWFLAAPLRRGIEAAIEHPHD